MSGKQQPFENELALLTSAGIPLVGDDDESGVRAECMRIARRLDATDKRVFGLVPLNDDSAVPPVAVQLGVALMELTGATVGYVDANVHWPALAPTARGHRPLNTHGEPFATRWLFRSLALLVPPRTEQAGAAIPQLEWVIREGSTLFKHVLVDLTGFHLLGDLDAAVSLVDGTILVGKAGKTRERDLLRARDRLKPESPDSIVGALLVG